MSESVEEVPGDESSGLREDDFCPECGTGVMGGEIDPGFLVCTECGYEYILEEDGVIDA